MTESAAASDAKRIRLSQSDVPAVELEKALKLAQAIWDQFAGRGAKPLQLAVALEVKPSSGGWREITGASIAYGLTDGGYNAQEIKLTDLGRRIVAPKIEGDDAKALVEASLTPRVCKEFLSKYNKAKFPTDKIAASVLVDFGVPKERTEKVVGILRANCSYAGVIQTIKGENYISLETPVQSSRSEVLVDEVSDEELPEPARETKSKAPEESEVAGKKDERPAPRKIFVAHGRKHEALEAIKKALDRLKVPYVVALDEPHAGRPISEKVAQLMKDCSAGIFIFTPDEEFINADGAKVCRPSENVIYELGAGNVLWGRKIVILKEDSVYFPSDYRDLGYISFSMSNLASIQSNLLMELIALDFVRLQVG